MIQAYKEFYLRIAYSRVSQILAKVLLWVFTFTILAVFIPFTFSGLLVKVCQETDNATWEMLGIDNQILVQIVAGVIGLQLGLVFSIGVALGLVIFYADFRLK